MKKLLERLRGLLLTMYLRHRCACKVGKGLICEGFPRWHRRPAGNLEIGDNVLFGHHVEIQLRRKGKLIVHDNVLLGSYSIWAVNTQIEIGTNSMVAPFCGIRDGNHGMVLGTPMTFQDGVFKPVAIGSDVWIGEGARVLLGSFIPDGCVIAANAVVLGKSKLEPYCIYGGVPVRFLKKRESEQIEAAPIV